MQSWLKAEVSDLRIKAYSSVVRKKKNHITYSFQLSPHPCCLALKLIKHGKKKIPKPKSSAFSTVIVVYY